MLQMTFAKLKVFSSLVLKNTNIYLVINVDNFRKMLNIYKSNVSLILLRISLFSLATTFFFPTVFNKCTLILLYSLSLTKE